MLGAGWSTGGEGGGGGGWREVMTSHRRKGGSEGGRKVIVSHTEGGGEHEGGQGEGSKEAHVWWGLNRHLSSEISTRAYKLRPLASKGI